MGLFIGSDQTMWAVHNCNSQFWVYFGRGWLWGVGGGGGGRGRRGGYSIKSKTNIHMGLSWRGNSHLTAKKLNCKD